MPPSANPVLRLPRGIRLNNPGNIRHSPTKWLGQAAEQPDTAFVAFDEAIYGVRAIMKIMLTYGRQGVDTPALIAAKWAPPADHNDTVAYARALALGLDVTVDTALDLRGAATLIGLAQAIARQENGAAPAGRDPHWYGLSLYQQAAQMALTT